MTLKEVIILTHEYYSPARPMSDQVLLMYAADLAELDEQACIQAYERWRRNPKNNRAPRPAEIIELVNPEQFVAVEAQSREIAARIVGAVKSFGWCNAKQAQAFIGPIGWDAVQRRGGWSDLCQNLGTRINEATFQAQMRDLVEANLRYGSAIEDSIGALSESEVRSGQLLQFDRNVALLKGDGDGDGGGESA